MTPIASADPAVFSKSDAYEEPVPASRTTRLESLRPPTLLEPEELIAGLFEEAHLLAFAPDREQLAGLGVELASRYSGAAVVVLRLLDGGSHRLRVAAARGAESTGLIGTSDELGHALVPNSQGRIYGFEQVSEGSREVLRFLGASGGDVLAIAVTEGRFLLGTLELAEPDRGEFGPGELHAMQYLAEQLGHALAHAAHERD